MKTVIQRVKQASVIVDGKTVGSINRGLLVLLGISPKDGPQDADYLLNKIVNLRIFEDDNGKMNLSLADVGGSLLVISQFTLLADCRKGRRPSFVHAAPPSKAEPLYRYFVEKARQTGLMVATGIFGAEMLVNLVNHGPVTLLLESKS